MNGFRLDLKITDKQSEAFNQYWEYGPSSENSSLTEQQYASIPDIIDGLELTKVDKYRLVSYAFELPEQGLSYSLTSDGSISKTKLDVDAVPIRTFLTNGDISYSKTDVRSLLTLDAKELSELPYGRLQDYRNKLLTEYKFSVARTSPNSPVPIIEKHKKTLSVPYKESGEFER